MEFLSLEPFVPSGNEHEKSKKLFQELDFAITWDAGDYTGFARDNCRFILQKFYMKDFAENFMLSVRITSAAEFLQMVTEKNIAEKFGVRFTGINDMPYGKEVNMIDIAGVCWHFVEG